MSAGSNTYFYPDPSPPGITVDSACNDYLICDVTCDGFAENELSIVDNGNYPSPESLDDNVNHGTEPRDFLHDLTDLRSHNPKNMIIGHVNINSLRNKVEPLHGIMANSLCDILTLTETKIDGSFPSAQFSVKIMHYIVKIEMLWRI